MKNIIPYPAIRTLLYEVRLPVTRLADRAGYNPEYCRQVLRGIRNGSPRFLRRITVALDSILSETPQQQTYRLRNNPELAQERSKLGSINLANTMRAF